MIRYLRRLVVPLMVALGLMGFGSALTLAFTHTTFQQADERVGATITLPAGTTQAMACQNVPAGATQVGGCVVDRTPMDHEPADLSLVWRNAGGVWQASNQHPEPTEGGQEGVGPGEFFYVTWENGWLELRARWEDSGLAQTITLRYSGVWYTGSSGGQLGHQP